MSASARSTKDKEMAATLKKRGVRRRVCRCTECYRVVQLVSYPTHMLHHAGGKP